MNLFEPSSIAVVGASADEGSVGHDILQNLLTQGYEGEVYPINPKHTEMQGKKAYASVKDIDGDVDLAIIIVPAKIVPIVLKECAEKKVRSVVIISAGFSETGTKEGKELEEQIQTIAKTYPCPSPSPSIIGPNCLGILRPSINLNASFAVKVPPVGSVALISQSGATAVAIMDASETLGIGYSFVASIGNKTVMDESDLLEIALKDDETKVIGLYLESIKDGKRFLKTAAASTKPIVLLKAGVSKKGGQAASSHTGALAGSDAAIDALCKQTGIVRAHTSQEFLDLLEGLSTQPPLASPSVAIITNAGGPGILATDAAEAAGLTLPKLEEEIDAELKKHLPAAASTGNPIDVIGDAGVDRYKAALQAAGDSAKIDGVALLLTPQVMTPVEEVANALIAWRKNYPLMPVTTCLMGEENVGEQRLILQRAGIPCYETPERAIQALGALLPDNRSLITDIQKNDIRAADVVDIIGKQTGLLDSDTAQQICELYGINTVPTRLATTEEEAVSIAEDFGYPVIAKVSNKDIIHKTDTGGIKPNIQTELELRDAFTELTSPSPSPSPNPTNVLIQPMCKTGHEFIVGAVQDASFGHLILVGLGGIYTEVLEDTSFRIAPVTEKDAYTMLTELNAWKVLLGTRGKPQLNIDALAQLIERVSQLVYECPVIKDIDFNPVFVSEEEVVVADVKIVVQ